MPRVGEAGRIALLQVGSVDNGVVDTHLVGDLEGHHGPHRRGVSIEDLDVVDGHGVKGGVVAPAQCQAGMAVGDRGQRDRVAAVTARMRSHIGHTDKGVRAVEPAHAEGSPTDSLEAVVEGNGEVLQGLGKAWQHYLFHVAEALIAARPHQQGVAGQGAKIIVGVGNNHMWCIGRVGARRRALPAGGQFAAVERRGIRGIDGVKVLHIRNRHPVAVQHLHHRYRCVNTVDVVHHYHHRVNSRCRVNHIHRRYRSCRVYPRQRGVPMEGKSVGRAFVDDSGVDHRVVHQH